MKREKKYILLGIAIILLGLLAFFVNHHWLTLTPSFIGALLLLACAWYFHQLQPAKTRYKFMAVFCLVLGLLLLVKCLPGLGNFWGVLFLFTVSITFTSIYIRNDNLWWAVIPSGVFFTLAVIQLIDCLDWLSASEMSAIFFLGTGLTFLYLWINHKTRHKTAWALFVAIVSLLLSFLLLFQTFLSEIDTTLLFSLALVVAGIVIIIRTLTKEKEKK
jgi:uncharacterized membrane protein HdeD (DUF308 family)